MNKLSMEQHLQIELDVINMSITDIEHNLETTKYNDDYYRGLLCGYNCQKNCILRLISNCNE
jgi:hypothetical protein